MYTKISKKTKEIENKQKNALALPKNLKSLLEKKNKIKDIISELNHAQVTANQDIERLRKQAKLLQKHVGMKDIESELLRIHADINSMKKQKTFLESHLKELFSVLTVKKKS